MTRLTGSTAVLSIASALLAGYVGRLAVALLLGFGTATARAAPTPTAETARGDARANVGPANSSHADDATPRADALVDDIAVRSVATSAEASTVDATSAASEPTVTDWIAATPLGSAASSTTAIAEPFDVAVARHSERNAARPTALQRTKFQFLAYRSADRFDVTFGELAAHRRASPQTWMLLVASELAKRLPPEPPDAAHVPEDGELSVTQSAALRRVVDDYLRGCESVRRELWTSLHGDAVASKTPALDPRSVAAVFAGEHGVAVIPAGADAELDRLLDDLQRAESGARSDVEFILR